MGKLTKRFGVFKNIFVDLKFDVCKTDLTKEDMNLYQQDVEKVLDSFIGCDESCIASINFLKDLKEINWNLLHNLYFVACPIRNEVLVKRSKESREAKEKNSKKEKQPSTMPSGTPDIASIMASPMFAQMMSTVLPVVQKAFEGKDMSSLNINDVVSGLMTKDKEKCGGIDVEALITESVDKLKENFK